MKDVHELKNIFLCEKHFEEEFLRRNNNRASLDKNLLPVLTLRTEIGETTVSSFSPASLVLRKPSLEKVFQNVEFYQFKNQNSIASFSDVNESFLKKNIAESC